VGLLTDALLGLLDYGKRRGFNRYWSAWQRQLARSCAQARDDYDRDSALYSALLRLEEAPLAQVEPLITTGVGQHQCVLAIL